MPKNTTGATQGDIRWWVRAAGVMRLSDGTDADPETAVNVAVAAALKKHPEALGGLRANRCRGCGHPFEIALGTLISTLRADLLTYGKCDVLGAASHIGLCEECAGFLRRVRRDSGVLSAELSGTTVRVRFDSSDIRVGVLDSLLWNAGVDRSLDVERVGRPRRQQGRVHIAVYRVAPHGAQEEVADDRQ